MREIWKQRYQIREKLGEGGAGQVYKVWDLHLGKEWAMKEIKGDTDREFQVLKQLSGRAFPRIVDAFSEEGKNLLVMDYIQGITLEALLRMGPLEEKEMVPLVKQVAQALIYLHERNPVLLYMDLKPSNVILEEEGTIRLVDLGSVLIKGQGAQISGTFGFASPEQISNQQGGRLLNEQSDIFSFGMLLFSMITGKLDGLLIPDQRSRCGIAVHRYNPLVLPSLEKIIEKCTRGMAHRRYPSMREVYGQLELWEKKVNKGRKVFIYRRPLISLFLRGQWQQEKSILCTQGKNILPIAGRKVLGLVLAVITAASWLSFAFPSRAQERRADSQEKEETIGEEKSVRQELRVIIRDGYGRKVLVREGGEWETKDNLYFEIPWEEIDADTCEITIFCKQGEGKGKSFQVQCRRKS